MNDVELDVLVPSGQGLRSSDSALHAHALASEIKVRWDNGERADAWSVLTDHPELLAAKSIVLDLAYEEYCQRFEMGEAIDPAQFCHRFPQHRESLRRLIDVHRYLEQNPQLLPEGSTPHWPQVGETFLGFRLLEELGRGAFARVFLASEAALGQRRVAVKIAVQGAAEAQTLGRLEHPNIVPVNSIQVDADSGLTAICMPYLGNRTLCDVLEFAYRDTHVPARSNVIVEGVRPTESFDQRLPGPPDPLLLNRTYTEGVVHLIAQLADALAYAHSRGVCHLDLKPSNILVTPGGRPLLLDFNLCFDKRNTGQVCAGGTVPYMSPEQLPLLGPATPVGLRPSDARSDIFSLGVILYELLCGSLPFGSVPLDWPCEKMRDELLDRQKAGPRPMRCNGHVDRNLMDLVQRCLAFDRKDRPQSAGELAEALRRYLSPRQQMFRRAWKHRRVVLAGACLVIGVVLGGIYALSFRAPYSQRQLDRGLHAYREANFREAIEHLNEAVTADPNLARALFMRGRAYQQLNDVNMALADYLAADRLARDGPTLACIGYCHSRLDLHNPSIWNYEQAIEQGFAPAAVLNNLAYSYGQVKRYEEARQCLDRAIDLDPQLRAAYYNRAMLEWRHAVRAHEPLRESAMADMQAAVRLGPVTAELLRDTARVYAVAARTDRKFIEPALGYLQKALDMGQDVGQINSDSTFSALNGIPQFVGLLKNPPFAANVQTELRIIDPVSPLAD